jgi:SAM-dependent methyltransferase
MRRKVLRNPWKTRYLYSQQIVMANELFKFSGDRALNYDTYLGPFLFEPFGIEMARRVSATHINSVLELASGTGRVTRHLRKRLPSSVKLVASDLSPDMLEVAKSKFTNSDAIDVVVADMQNLPFESNLVDVVVCQFGIMFPPNKQKVFDEVHRVLRPGGLFLFSTWDKTDHVGIFKLVYNEHVLPFFAGEDPSRFLVPFSLYDPDQLKTFLTGSHFSNPKIERVSLKGVGHSAANLVKGFFTTHSMGEEIADRDAKEFEAIAQRMEKAIIERFSDHPVVCELFAFFGSGVKRSQKTIRNYNKAVTVQSLSSN